MPQPKSRGAFAESLALYEALLATNKNAVRKGATNPYTSLNGHMFTHLDPAGTLSLRLPEAELEAFCKKYKTERPVQYGVVKKDWAIVPPALLKKTKELAPYLETSVKYVKSLKPKK